VDAAIYDVLGRRVRTLKHGVADAGSQVLRWDGRDERGRPADPGSYFVRAASQGSVAMRRLARLR
jgi:flagellar hook assembly protein FlgD